MADTLSSAWLVQVMVHSPRDTPLIRPSLPTVATLSSEEVQITFLSSAFLGRTVALAGAVLPTSMVTSPDASSMLSGRWTTLTV